jgi:hypothetical protein
MNPSILKHYNICNSEKQEALKCFNELVQTLEKEKVDFGDFYKDFGYPFAFLIERITETIKGFEVFEYGSMEYTDPAFLGKDEKTNIENILDKLDYKKNIQGKDHRRISEILIKEIMSSVLESFDSLMVDKDNCFTKELCTLFCDKGQSTKSSKTTEQNKYKTFLDLLVNKDDLAKIRTVLGEHELLKSDGSIKVGTAKNSDKSHIRALYAALDSNDLIVTNDKEIFIRLLEIEFRVSITKRSLENLPTKNGTDKASENYKDFLKKFPKVQR